MYALRGIAVSLSIFFILYVALSLAVRYSWRVVVRYGRQASARSQSNLLFALRIIPAALAVVATVVFAVPSFVILEPRSAAEPLGVLPVALACGGIAVLLSGLWNSAVALARASSAVRRWSIGARALNSTHEAASVSVLRTLASAPPLTAAGILKPTVWLSGAAEFVLNERELESALRHEYVHVRRRDNLRKLILRTVAFPGMAQLENLWREATEMAADDAAVCSASEALDLATAVIKLSRIEPAHPLAELTTALVHSSAESLNARVKRLIEWKQPVPAPHRNSLHYALCSLTILAGVAMTYSGLLVRVHEATEWLVR